MRPWSLVLLLAACATTGTPTDDDTTTDAVDSGDTGTDAPDPDLVRACILGPWFERECTGCHFGGNHLDLTSDSLEVLTTTNRETAPTEPIVVPGDADASLLVRKLEANVGLVTLDEDEGDPMPADKTITAADAQLVREWVASGAPLPTGCE